MNLKMIKNKKSIFTFKYKILHFVFFAICAAQFSNAQSTNLYSAGNMQTDTTKNIVSQNDAQEAIEKLKASLKNVLTDTEKQDIYVTMASLQEQLGLFPEAQNSYNAAAALLGMSTVSGQTFMLDAIRCALSFGDIASADFLLSTQFEQPQSTEISAQKKLYALWSWLSKSENKDDIQSVYPVLETYAVDDSMVSVQPVVLLTLFELTDQNKWHDTLISKYPDSPEAAIAQGTAQLLPSPFWYFSLIKNE